MRVLGVSNPPPHQSENFQRPQIQNTSIKLKFVNFMNSNKEKNICYEAIVRFYYYNFIIFYKCYSFYITMFYKRLIKLGFDNVGVFGCEKIQTFRTQEIF